MMRLACLLALAACAPGLPADDLAGAGPGPDPGPLTGGQVTPDDGGPVMATTDGSFTWGPDGWTPDT